ncbi:MAG: HD-GYP domain-containing protein [Clostridiaceae bacterium]
MSNKLIKKNLYKSMILSDIKLLGLHNPYTKQHSENVAHISSKIAKKLEMTDEEIDNIYWTGLVHDIGKILISDDILDKKGKLTNEEYEIVKKHPVWGYETLNTNIDLSKIAKDVLHHHERWDGNGYPHGLKEDNIPYVSRIIAVADTYDAMTSDRPYRGALSHGIAINEIKKNSGTQFDPEIVKAFVEEMGA